MKKRLMMALVGLLLSLGTVLAQNQVKGTVVSADDGQPVVGATVKVVGTNNGTVTNVDGQFSLSVRNGAVLEVSYVGMATKKVNASSNMRISLDSDQQMLDEVMVVAFGTQKKSAFTGSAAVMNTEDLQIHTVSNVADALAGSVPGLQIRNSSGEPGSNGGSINIRGLNSLYASTDPLIIVDGAPYPASLTNIPPNDIESITVLKDAASAALYGARGANGVILITTKSGKSKEAQITVDAKWGVNSRAVQDYDRITDPGQFYETYYAQLYNYQHYGQGIGADAANVWANSTMLNHLGYNVYTLPEGEQLIGMNGKLNPAAKLGRSYEWNDETYYMTPDDWTDAAYSNALRQEYTVTASASHDRGNFYASFSHLDEDGIIEYSSYKRTTARLKADYQLKQWAKLGVNANYTHSDTKSNPNMSDDWGSTNLMYYTSYIAPIYPIYVRVLDANGNPVVRTDANGNPQYDYGVPATNYGVGRAFLQTGNPLGSNRYNSVKTIGNQFNGNASLDIFLTKNLRFNNTSTIILGQTIYSDYENALYGPKVGVNGEITKQQTNTLRQNHVQTLNYSNEWGSHELTVLLGHEWWDQKTRYLSASRTGGFSAEIPELNAFATMSGSNSYTTEYNVEGYFGSLQYNYDDKYFLSGSYRRDATSYFNKDNRWGNFWSIGAAWLISKENFMEGTKSWLDQLKVKVSIGEQGNDQIGSFAYVDLYSLSKATDTSMSPSFYRLGNPDITWETLLNTNFGVEFSLWKGRLTGSLDVYYRKTFDQLFWLSIPESAGTRGYYGNAGDIRNQGIELTLSGSIIRTKDFEWMISGNMSHNSSKILKLPEAKIKDNGGFFESPFWYAEGEPINNYMTYAYAGVNEYGEALYYYDANLSPLGGNATNTINVPGKEKSGTTTNIGEASRYTSGSTLPKVFGGFSTSLRWKGFDAAVIFDFQIGGKIYDSGYAKLMTPATSVSDAGYTYHKDVLNAWTPNNTSSNIPRWQYGDEYAAYGSDRWLTNASYLNFQSFTIGYTIPKVLTSSIGVSSLRVYAAGENLGFWSARKGLDPRYSFESTANTTVYSPVRTISGGIQLTF